MYQINIHMSCRSHMYILHTLCRIIVYCPSRAKMIIHNSASGRGEESNWKDYHLVWGWAHNGWLNSQQVNRTVSVQLDDQAVHTHEGADVSYYSIVRTTASIVWSFVGLDMSDRLTRIQTHIQTRVHGHAMGVVRVQETRERTCACWTPRLTSWTMPVFARWERLEQWVRK